MRKLLYLLFCLFLTACSGPQHSFVWQDNTVIDQATGLVWTRSANPAGKQLYWRGDDNVYNYILKMNSENYAGYADWRVPTKDEMTAMVRYAKSLGYDAAKFDTWPFQKLRQVGFADVRDYDYWTSTRHSPEAMWTADLASGEVEAKPDSKPYYLWPVRGRSDR